MTVYTTKIDDVLLLSDEYGVVLDLAEGGEWRIDFKGERGEKNVMNVPGVLAGRFYLVPVPGTVKADIDWTSTP